MLSASSSICYTDAASSCPFIRQSVNHILPLASSYLSSISRLWRLDEVAETVKNKFKRLDFRGVLVCLLQKSNELLEDLRAIDDLADDGVLLEDNFDSLERLRKYRVLSVDLRLQVS